MRSIKEIIPPLLINVQIANTKQLTIMTSFIAYLKLLFRKFNRKRLHSTFIYTRILDIRNSLVRKLLDLDTDIPIKVIRKARKIKGDKNSYIICQISEEDLHLLSEAKTKLKLVKKYRRRLILLHT